MKYGHYIQTRKMKILQVTDHVSIAHAKNVYTLHVAGKKEARQYCKDHDVKPWNF